MKVTGMQSLVGEGGSRTLAPATAEYGNRRESERRFRVLGIGVDVLQIPNAVDQMSRWIDGAEAGRYVAVTGMHGMVESYRNPRMKRALRAADLVVPDGMSLVWLGRWNGFRLRRRVYGPELMWEFCRKTRHRGFRHFLFGGLPGVAGELADRMADTFPGLNVVGTYTPPFREGNEPEPESVLDRINRTAPDILWVGLSTPKQEIWMHENRGRLNVPVLVGVGAAFDFHTGRVRQSPVWMREHGLEWLWRLLQEPRRLWRRYLLGGGQFVLLVGMEFFGFKKFD